SRSWPLRGHLPGHSYTGRGFKASTSFGAISRPPCRRSSVKNSLKPACTCFGVLLLTTREVFFLGPGCPSPSTDLIMTTPSWALSPGFPAYHAAGDLVIDHHLLGKVVPL